MPLSKRRLAKSGVMLIQRLPSRSMAPAKRFVAWSMILADTLLRFRTRCAFLDAATDLVVDWRLPQCFTETFMLPEPRASRQPNLMSHYQSAYKSLANAHYPYRAASDRNSRTSEPYSLPLL